MKLVKFCVRNCADCPHLQYKYEDSENKYLYYCKFMYKYIDNEIDIRFSIPKMCGLENC